MAALAWVLPALLVAGGLVGRVRYLVQYLAALAVVLPVVVVLWVDPAPGFLALLVGLLAGLVCLACLLLALLGLLLRRVRGKRRGISGALPVR